MIMLVNILLVIDAIIMIVLVLLQSGKSEGLSGAISGGAEQLFGKQKARGLDLVLHRGTVITGVLFFVLAFLSAFILQ
ncbi:preprotein translocase subunit SecG [Virgibacillus halophilus]|uniref:Protein-export membrane protein SecG n=2 Tax=Tigheibacillus halophilus TaxID=361280 RepID=A0ABU5C9F9_9BACI|nr:preprotein translocase subunit SecG [Virgibacillus halophilus]